MNAVLVVPCHNEARRLDHGALAGLVSAAGGPGLLLVDDGSSDDTGRRLQALADQHPGRIRCLALPTNRGKAEAVRQGMLAALTVDANGHTPDLVGYFDADLATPPEELRRLLAVFRARDVDVLLAARVALLGRQIRRSQLRHYLGRVFASAASMVLSTTVYDTQCGAKLFRRTPALAAALSEPFLSRWIFDVELLGRLLVGAPGVEAIDGSRFVEEPLLAWRDVPGSKLSTGHMAGAAADLVRVARDLARRRRTAGRPHTTHA